MSQTLFSQICHRDVSMAIGCFKSLKKSWQEGWTLNLVEDGSVTPEDWELLRIALPTAMFHRKHEVKDRTEQLLRGHPACLALYRTSVVAPKLLEAPLLSAGDFHFCDPDLLFFQRIERLWPTSSNIIFLCEKYGFTGYSHSVFDLTVRNRLPLAGDLNSGMFRFPMRVHDLDKIEWFLNRAKNLLRPFLIEQTCFAFLVADVPHRLIAPDEVLCTQAALPEDLPPVIHFIGGQKANFWKYVPEADKILERETLSEFRTIEGRRISRSRIATQVVRGVRRRIVSAISAKGGSS